MQGVFRSRGTLIPYSSSSGAPHVHTSVLGEGLHAYGSAALPWVGLRPLCTGILATIHGYTASVGSSSALVLQPTLGSDVLESIGFSILVLCYIREWLKIMICEGRFCMQRHTGDWGISASLSFCVSSGSSHFSP